MATPSEHIERVGIGTDLHRLEPNRPLRLGGVAVPFDRGAMGHSDGDVVLHALIDALSGAAGLPDIGEQFPDTDPRFKNADSATLLASTLQLLHSRGWQPVNVNIVIHAERPKLSPYKSAIRERMSSLLGISSDRISIKAKTNEGTDAVGRGEAIACTAIVGLCRTPT